LKNDDSSPGWLWRGSLSLLIAAILLMIGLLVATLAGVADPRPLGRLTVEDRFEHPDAWQTRSGGASVPSTSQQPLGRYRLKVAAGGQRVVLTGPYLIHAPCTIEVSAQQIDGASDVEYGMWWGQSESAVNLWEGINSNGYLGIEPASPPGGQPLRDWELFPHVRPLGQVNVFRVDIDAPQVVIRLNDEVAGKFIWTAPSVIVPGLVVQPTTEGSATIDFLVLRVWEAQPQ
jgi:hypothetical protein